MHQTKITTCPVCHGQLYDSCVLALDGKYYHEYCIAPDQLDRTPMEYATERATTKTPKKEAGG